MLAWSKNGSDITVGSLKKKNERKRHLEQKNTREFLLDRTLKKYKRFISFLDKKRANYNFH